jgi:hypothetical protein
MATVYELADDDVHDLAMGILAKHHPELKMRDGEYVNKRADAEILIDMEQWEKLTDNQRLALLDHEITHLEVQVDDVGLVKTDDQGRPKLKLKLHDWQLGGFRSIAQRYGADAIEVMEANRFSTDYGDVALDVAEKIF